MALKQKWHKGPRPEMGVVSGEQEKFYEALKQIIGLEVVMQSS
jgi:hypothetical protein